MEIILETADYRTVVNRNEAVGDAATVAAATPAYDTGDTVDDAGAAGNWGVFRQRCAFLDGTRVLGVQQNIDVKRHYALAYLGDRAQMRGGVFRASKPTVFTETMVVALGKRNTAARFARYPWLAQMLALVTALDDAQYNVTNHDRNVLTFPESGASRTAAP